MERVYAFHWQLATGNATGVTRESPLPEADTPWLPSPDPFGAWQPFATSLEPTPRRMVTLVLYKRLVIREITATLPTHIN